ncbi:hypothetical protein LFREDSHE_26430 [Shewanella baltica]
MSAIYNFCAGPAMLPAAVMKKAQQELLDWNGQGVSVMEISHRSKEFIALTEQAESDLRELMQILQITMCYLCTAVVAASSLLS